MSRKQKNSKKGAAHSSPVGLGKMESSFVGNDSDDLEPRAQRKSPPVWLVVLFALLFYWIQLFLDSSVAAFQPEVSPAWPDTKTLASVQVKDPSQIILDMGKTKYKVACEACHQPSGLGTPGQFPPLAGSEWVNTAGIGRIGRIASKGLIGPVVVKGQAWNLAMPGGLTDGFSDEEFAALLSYVRNSWGNKAPFATPEQVKELREKIKDRFEQWKAEELQTIPESE